MQSEVKERLIYELSNGICRFPAAVDLNITFIDSHQEKKTGKVLDVITGTKGTWTFHVENFHGDFGPETRFIPLATNYHFAHKCQTQKPKGRDYTTIQACTDAKLQIGPGSRYGFTCPFYIEVEEGVFKKGDSFTVTVGDRSCGSKGSETYWTVTEGTVYLFIEKEDRIETSDYPPVKIFGKPHPEVRYIRTILPTVAAPKEEFDVTVGVYDRNSNIIEDFSGTVILEGTDGFQGLKDRLFFTKADRGTVKIKGISCREEGVKRITARLEEGRQGYLSNPLKVMKN